MDKDKILQLIEDAWHNGYMTRAYRSNSMGLKDHFEKNIERYMESVKKGELSDE